MDQLLLNEPPLVILPKFAAKIGLNEAIVIQQIHYWIIHNLSKDEDKDKNYREGKYWAYNSYPKWQKNNFPFWSVETVKRTFQKCEKEGYLLTGNFNQLNYDRTKWYTINYEKLGIDRPWGQNDPTVSPTVGSDRPVQKVNMTRPIPETTTETTKIPETTTNKEGSIDPLVHEFWLYWLGITPNENENLSKKKIAGIKATINQWSLEQLMNAAEALVNDAWSISNGQVNISRLIDTKDGKRERNMNKFLADYAKESDFDKDLKQLDEAMK